MNEFTIRVATQEDLARIRGWLTQEHEANHGESFLSNFNLIESGQASGILFAMVRDTDDLPLAFSLGDGNIDILAVHHRMRRQGFGRCLVQHAIDRALSLDLIGLCGECAPSTSKPFWLSMGFVSVRPPSGGDNPNWVALPLRHDNVLPTMTTHEVVISASNTSNEFSDTFVTQGVFENGLLQLARDFSHYKAYCDARLKISFDGTELYCDKAKYLREQGVECDTSWIRVRSVQIG